MSERWKKRENMDKKRENMDRKKDSCTSGFGPAPPPKKTLYLMAGKKAVVEEMMLH